MVLALIAGLFTYFMTAVGDVRVLPEDLTQSAGRLRPAFERLLGA